MFVVLAILIGAFALLAPGSLLSFLLFQGEKSLDFWERMATSAGLSGLIDMLIVLILAQRELGALRLLPFMGSILLFCGACGALILWRKQSRAAFLDFWSRSGAQE